jgi:hypothetical protein
MHHAPYLDFYLLTHCTHTLCYLDIYLLATFGVKSLADAKKAKMHTTIDKHHMGAAGTRVHGVLHEMI